MSIGIGIYSFTSMAKRSTRLILLAMDQNYNSSIWFVSWVIFEIQRKQKLMLHVCWDDPAEEVCWLTPYSKVGGWVLWFMLLWLFNKNLQMKFQFKDKIM